MGQVGCTPVAKLTSPSEALGVISERQPDLFVLDTEMNGASPDGLTCLREAIGRVASLKVVVVSAANDPQRINAAFTAGAVAYVLKRAQPEDLASAVRQVFARSFYLLPSDAVGRPSRSEAADAAGLTRREREVLQLVANGNTNGQVAGTLWVTEQTVKFHLANIFRKLDVTNRTQASRWAHANGLLRDVASAGQSAVG
jgi:DNA-binding NarL/FixJ family response regulator